MPELPDLNIYKKNLNKTLKGCDLRSIVVDNPRKVSVAQNVLDSTIVGKKLDSVDRYGKELIFNFDGDKVFVHLMLKGEMQFVLPDDIPSIKYKIITFKFDDINLVISDPKSMCRISLNPLQVKVPDALGENFTFDYFIEKVDKNKDKNVKAFLVDQSIVKGIGNAYSDEILYEANISPKSVLGTIPGDKLELIYKSIEKVLREAYIHLEELTPDAINGENRSFLKVHRKDTNIAENGEEIIVKKIVNKDTYFVQSQVVYK